MGRAVFAILIFGGDFYSRGERRYLFKLTLSRKAIPVLSQDCPVINREKLQGRWRRWWIWEARSLGSGGRNREIYGPMKELINGERAVENTVECH
jgi:hypothetical protein